MAQIKKLKLNGKTIYPVTHPKAVIDPSSGRSITAAATQSANGLMSAADKKKLDNFPETGIPSNYVTTDTQQTITGRKDFTDGITANASSKFDNIQITGDIDIQNDCYITFEEGFHISTAFGDIEPPAGSGVLALKSDIPSIPGTATSSTNGLMSAADKKKLDSLATVATSGNYNDLKNRPTIPSLSGYATQTWVNQQGFLKSVSWSNITDKPTIPSTSGFLQSHFSYQYDNNTHDVYFGRITSISTESVGFSQKIEPEDITYIVLQNLWATIKSPYIRLVADLSDGGIQFNRQPSISSDERLKENIEPVKNDDPRLSYAASIELKNFNYKGSHLSTMGYIAQDVQKVLPSLVNEDKEGFLSLNYTELLALKVASLEKKNSDLETRIQKLESLVAKLTQPQTEV